MTMSHLDQAREFLQFIKGSGIKKYDCSTRNESEWFLEGERRPVLGGYYLASGTLFQVIAIAVLISMARNQELMKLPCAKFMLYIGLVETTELWVTSFFYGFVCIVGGVFCTHPALQTISGKTVMFQWLSSSLACVVLAVDRFAELSQYPPLQRLFDNAWKVYTILAAVTLYGVYFSICSDTPTFNSKSASILFTPLNDYDQSQFNHLPFWHNPLLVILMSTIYLLLFVSVFTHYSAKWGEMSRLQRNLVIQSSLLALLYVVPASMLFIGVFFDSSSPITMTIGQLTYQWASGFPCVIYLCYNKAIRTSSLRMIGWKGQQNAIADVSTRSEQYVDSS